MDHYAIYLKLISTKSTIFQLKKKQEARTHSALPPLAWSGRWHGRQKWLLVSAVLICSRAGNWWVWSGLSLGFIETSLIINEIMRSASVRSFLCKWAPCPVPAQTFPHLCPPPFCLFFFWSWHAGSWIFIGRTDAEAEAPILWPLDGKRQLNGKDPDAGKD